MPGERQEVNARRSGAYCTRDAELQRIRTTIAGAFY